MKKNLGLLIGVLLLGATLVVVLSRQRRERCGCPGTMDLTADGTRGIANKRSS